jgi:L-amino acid N-acyltransferase YncA
MNTDIEIRSATIEDLEMIKSIFSEWLSSEETEHYTEAVRQRIEKSPESIKYGNHYFVSVLDGTVIGVAGYRKPIPKLQQFVSTDNPAELSMLYVTSSHRGGKGIGTALLSTIIDQTKKEGYLELVVRSSEKFKDSGWGFYDKFEDLERVGQLTPPESKQVSQVWAMKY